MPVTFIKPLFLLLLFMLPVVYFIYVRSSRYTGVNRPFVIGLRIILLVCLILALARPQIMIPVKKQTIIFVVDLSQSMKRVQGDIRHFIKESLNEKNEIDQTGIITFGKDAFLENSPDIDYPFSDFETEPDDDFTNIESALRLARKNIDKKEGTRVVLLSDGQANQGQIAEIAATFKKEGIPVDVKSFSHKPEQEIQINGVFSPEKIRPGQNFQLKVNIAANSEASGELRLYHNDNLIKKEDITINQGENLYTYQQTLNESGFHNYRVELAGEPDTFNRNNFASSFVVVTGQKRLLILGDKGSGIEQLKSTVSDKNVSVTTLPAGSFPENWQKLQSYGAVILNNIPISLLSRREIEILQSFVEDNGGGLIVSGGDSSLGPGNYSQSLLEEMLPVTTALEQEAYTPSLSLLLLVDKSGSMGDAQTERNNSSKIEIGKRAARASAEILLQREKIGIIAFDNEADIVLPLQRATNMSEILAKVETIRSEGGGTNIYPALNEANAILHEEKTATKHIILISDGITKSGEFEEITKEMSANGITLSTIAIGNDANLELMARLANWGQGKSYYTTDISSIPQILTTETGRITPSATVKDETRVMPVNRNISFMSDINWEQAPPLYGFIKTTPRTLANVYLQAPDKSPILAGWRYGLGRTLVFTSDLGGDWSREWLNWQDYNNFWQEVINWVLPDSSKNNLFPAITVKGDRGKIVINAVDKNGNLLNFLNLTARIKNSAGNIQEKKLSQTGSGKYETDFSVGNPGTHMVNIFQQGETEQKVVTTGITVPYSPEYRFSFSENSNQLLVNLANYTGGRVLQSPEEIYQDSQVTYAEPFALSDYLLILALIIFMIDVGIRTVSWQSVKSIFTNPYSGSN